MAVGWFCVRLYPIRSEEIKNYPTRSQEITNQISFRTGGSSYCLYEWVAYDDLPEVTVSFWTNHVESRVGVVTPHFGRKMQLLSLLLLLSLLFI